MTSTNGTWVSLDEALVAWGAPVHPDVLPIALPTVRSSAHDKRDAALILVLLVGLIGALAVFASGCSSVSQAEYRASVEADEAFCEAVSPTYLKAIEASDLPETSKANRRALVEDHRVSLKSRKARAGIDPKPPECPDDEMPQGGSVCFGPCRFMWLGAHVHEGPVVRVLR